MIIFFIIRIKYIFIEIKQCIINFIKYFNIIVNFIYVSY